MAKVLAQHEELMKQAKQFQYIRFICSDLNGIAKGKTTTRHGFNQLQTGMKVDYGKTFHIVIKVINQFPAFKCC